MLFFDEVHFTFAFVPLTFSVELLPAVSVRAVLFNFMAAALVSAAVYPAETSKLKARDSERNRFINFPS
jgi:hypothetical protein